MKYFDDVNNYIMIKGAHSVMISHINNIIDPPDGHQQFELSCSIEKFESLKTLLSLAVKEKDGYIKLIESDCGGIRDLYFTPYCGRIPKNYVTSIIIFLGQYADELPIEGVRELAHIIDELESRADSFKPKADLMRQLLKRSINDLSISPLTKKGD